MNLLRLSTCRSPAYRNFELSKHEKQKSMKTIKQNNVVSISRQGPPSVLEYTKTTIGDPKGNEVLIRQEAIAVNFVDVLFRNGSFPLTDFPAIIGVEAAAVVEAVGSGIKNLAAGDRVAYYFSPGSYARLRFISENDLVKLPNYISFDTAASLMAKGLTARMLVKQAYAVKPGDFILVHAAAGGVGSLVSKWAKALGAKVIGTVGNSSKKAFLLNQGIDHVIDLDSENMDKEVRSLTNNQGVQAIFDGVGKATFNKSVELLRNGGTAVLYGTASGEPQINSAYLSSKQIRLVRPSLNQYLPDQKSINMATGELFDAFRTGILGEIKPTVYALADVSKAHQDLESGQTTGSIILHP